MNTKLTKKAIALLRKVQAEIIKHPDQFYMGWWFQDGTFQLGGNCDVEVKIGGCGTAACIAGWLAHIESGNKKLSATRRCGTPQWRAADLLRLGNKESDKLFCASDWPDRYNLAYINAKTPLAAARVAVNRIDHFIKTGQ